MLKTFKIYLLFSVAILFLGVYGIITVKMQIKATLNVSKILILQTWYIYWDYKLAILIQCNTYDTEYTQNDIKWSQIITTYTYRNANVYRTHYYIIKAQKPNKKKTNKTKLYKFICILFLIKIFIYLIIFIWMGVLLVCINVHQMYIRYPASPEEGVDTLKLKLQQSVMSYQMAAGNRTQVLSKSSQYS